MRFVTELQELAQDEEKLIEKGVDVSELAYQTKSDLEVGLTTKQVGYNRALYGRNVLPEIESKSFFDLLVAGMEDNTLIMLSIAAVISLALGLKENPSTGWIEGFAILLAVAIVVFVTAINDYEKEKQFRKLNSKKDMKNVRVVRDGLKTEVMVHDIVVGDIVVIDTGDIFGADGIFVSGHNLLCDESSATGETDSKKKGTMEGHSPLFISGSKCLDGVGRMCVFAVGEKSFQGKNMMSLREEAEETPLQSKLDDLANDIGKFGLIMAVIMFVVLFIRDSYYVMITEGQSFDEHFMSSMVRYVITSITILVVAIPEGLPLAVTMALAYSMVKMLEDNNLVRKLEACETMGGATNICSDKTGTLTQNVMTVVKGHIANLSFDSSKVDVSTLDKKNVVDVIADGIAVNSTAFRKPGETEFIGSKTESALLVFGENISGKDTEKTRKNAKIVHIFPFSSANKQMSTLVDMGNKSLRLHVKGAAEIVLERCDNLLNADGSVVTMTDTLRKDFLKEINDLAGDALRTIALAYVDIVDTGKTESDWEEQEPQEPLVFIGVVGIEDPIRPEVVEAVDTCKKAGITVRMVTGDNVITAQNIASRCGIYNGDEKTAMIGPDFRKLKGDALKNAAQNITVLARSSPQDKKILVDTLRSLGEVVAVTGDGTNDGPALKSAHVGFSMGIAGTDVAIEASDIVLMDDNFSSIVKAVMWGRNVYDSIRKFIQFQLTVNIVAVVLAFVGSLTNESGESPLKPVQLLWVNLIMDTLAALALATEKPTMALLDRAPYGSDSKTLITSLMWRSIIGQAIFQMIILFTILYQPTLFFEGVEIGTKLHLTLFFNAFVMCQLFNEINSRKIHGETNIFEGLFDNYVFIVVMTLTLVVQYLMVEFGGDFVGCTSLSGEQWTACIFIGSLSLPLAFCIQHLPFWNQDEGSTLKEKKD